MRPGGQNAKGGAFERLVCRRLTEWITGTPTPEVLWRSATSGAKATVDRAAGRESHMGGDLVAIHPKGQPFIDKYSVECKDRKSYGRLENLVVGKGELLQWWLQCAEDANHSQRMPLLIYKGNRTPIYIAHWINMGFVIPRLTFKCPFFSDWDVGIVLFDDWLAQNKWRGGGGVQVGAGGKLTKVGS